jgi:hypothetical protein
MRAPSLALSSRSQTSPLRCAYIVGARRSEGVSPIILISLRRALPLVIRVQPPKRSLRSSHLRQSTKSELAVAVLRGEHYPPGIEVVEAYLVLFFGLRYSLFVHGDLILLVGRAPETASERRPWCTRIFFARGRSQGHLLGRDAP